MDYWDHFYNVITGIQIITLLILAWPVWRRRKERADYSRYFLVLAILFVIFFEVAWSALYYYTREHPLQDHLLIAQYNIALLLFQMLLLLYPLEIMYPRDWRPKMQFYIPGFILLLQNTLMHTQTHEFHHFFEVMENMRDPEIRWQMIMCLAVIPYGLSLLFMVYNNRRTSVNHRQLRHYVIGALILVSCYLTIQFTPSWIPDMTAKVFGLLFFAQIVHQELHNRLEVPKQEPIAKRPTVKPESSKNAPPTDVIWQRIEKLLHEDKLFTDPDLSLDALSKRAHSNRVYVSQAFHENVGVSYADYLKLLRINYVLDALKQQKNLSEDALKSRLNDLFYDAGYRSYATGLRHFRERTGQTPTEYLLSQRSSLFS